DQPGQRSAAVTDPQAAAGAARGDALAAALVQRGGGLRRRRRARRPDQPRRRLAPSRRHRRAVRAGARGVTAPAPIPAAEPLLRVLYRRGDPSEELIAREWIVTNGLGGYASGTIGGVPTRRFHGLLVAALPAPLGRTMMVNHVLETLRLRDGTEIALGGLEPDPGPLSLPEALLELRLENGRPTWLFEHAGVVLEKSLVVPHRRNTAHVFYRLLAAPAAAQPLTLRLEPLFDVRSHDTALAGRAGEYEARPAAHGTTVLAPDPVYPPIHLLAWPPAPPPSAEQPAGPAPLSPGARTLDLVYRVEQARGYDCR